MPIIVSAAVLLGLAIGSFLNVVIARVPVGESIVTPPSHCPRCAMTINARHNVPLLGWLMLRGRCHSCALPISVRYPAVEVVTAVAFAVTTTRAITAHGLAALPFQVALIVTAVVAVAIDLDGLADRLAYACYGISAMAAALVAVVDGSASALLYDAAAGLAVAVTAWLIAAVDSSLRGPGAIRRVGFVVAAVLYLSRATFPGTLLIAAAVLGGCAALVAAVALTTRHEHPIAVTNSSHPA